jgi:putative ABC transport system ATP-binding protein
MPHAVHCHSLTKSYATTAQPVRALRGVDLTVEEGELLMLVGPSGCGKTTLISIIAGILSEDSGDCTVLGERWSGMSSSQRAAFRARHIGFVFQQFHLIPTLTLAANVSIPLLLQGVDQRAAQRHACLALEQVGLAGRQGDLPRALSGGQQQRVAIARALVHDPRLIVCDEPTSALDHDTGQQILTLLRGLTASQRRTLLIVTHDNRIYSYADRIATMDDGSIQSISTTRKDPPHA